MKKVHPYNEYSGRVFPYHYEKEFVLLDENIVNDGVKEIIKTTEQFIKKPLKTLNVLDVGSGRGEYTREFAKYYQKIVGIEPFKDVYEFSLKTTSKNLKNITFINTYIENYTGKEKYDVIVLLTVFEHMQHPDKAFEKLLSMLKKDGIIYITAPNKYWLFEQHYGLPFLSWLPLPLANIYLKTMRGVESYQDSSYSKSYSGMKKFFEKFNCKYEFIVPLDEDYSFIGCGTSQPLYHFVRKMGIQLIKLNSFFWNLSKGFIVIVTHKTAR